MVQVIPAGWMPKSAAKRIIVHWTGGGSDPSELDKEHYHILIGRKGEPLRGEHAISDNDWTQDDNYAAHTRGANTGSVGLALCGMLGATEEPFSAGKYPLTNAQWNAALLACADLCRQYHIPPEPKRLLMHSEVAHQLGIEQRGKWDINVRTWKAPAAYARLTPGEELRARVRALLSEPGL
jgi:N-acetyl-anhydromuramyl-L-alanine amidase AmpD